MALILITLLLPSCTNTQFAQHFRKPHLDNEPLQVLDLCPTMLEK